ncbi:glycosyltransferase-like domain-containing protein 1 isoform X2 [Lytechinus pictus]|uniref:glycosyltransferase-like domain-containing protein 1 isoform X2 n=1 Tax=Lytechinus pictus TaxID=7653 RepID=UPI0030B9EB3B
MPYCNRQAGLSTTMDAVKCFTIVFFLGLCLGHDNGQHFIKHVLKPTCTVPQPFLSTSACVRRFYAMSADSRKEDNRGVLLLEPFYGGSHRQLIDLLHESIPECTLFTLPASKWHWRARTSALYFSAEVPYDHSFSVLFASSVLNLAELVALRPDLARIRKILYFHENQLVYPVQKHKDRDFQYGYNQILSCLVADVIVFNSYYNQESSLTSIDSFLKLMPNRPKKLAERIRPKCQVLYFPLDFPPVLPSKAPEPDMTVPSGKYSDTPVCHDVGSGHSSEHTPDQSVWSPDCKPSSSAAKVTSCAGGGCSPVQPGLMIDTAYWGHLGEGDFRRKEYGMTFDDLQDNRVSSRVSVDNPGSPAGRAMKLQQSKEMFALRVHVIDSVDHASFPKQEDWNEIDEQSFDDQKGIPVLFQNSLESSEVGRSSQDSKEMSCASRIPVTNTTAPANVFNQEDTNEDTITDVLPDCSTFTEQCDSICQGIEKTKIASVGPYSGGSCCHASTDEKRVGDCSSVKDGNDNGRSIRPLHILWPHRWEHDKNPDQFFSVLFQLHEQDCSFHVSVLGESYLQVPPIFEEAKLKLKDHILSWGFLSCKEDYYRILSEADVVVSTANHEFFGVAMLEATYYQCYPLCPTRLVYPEIFPAEHLYRTPTQLLKKLKRFCRNPNLVRCYHFQGDLTKYSWNTLQGQYHQLLITDEQGYEDGISSSSS